MRRVPILVLALALVMAGAVSAADITVSMSVTIPTYLTMTLTDGADTATATQTPGTPPVQTTDTMALQFMPTGAPAAGQYLESSDYTLTVTCNNDWDLSVTGDTDLSSVGGDIVALTWTLDDGTTWSSPIGYSASPAFSTTDYTQALRFRIPYTWAQRAGSYTGSVTFTATSL